MSTDRELLASLRDGFEQLDLFDRSGLNSLRDRGRMIIRRVFGPDSSYIERLSNIEFHYTGMTITTLGAAETSGEKEGRGGSDIGVWDKGNP